MFNLVKYRYLFLGISLLIIIPGVISLFARGLNVGLDFKGGSSIELRPQVATTSTQVLNLIKPFHLQDASVVLGSDPTLTGGKTVWIRLNTRIDTTVQQAIQSDITGKYANTNVKFYDEPLNGQTVTMVVADGFSTVPQVSDIQTLLSKLPNTTDVTKTSTSTTATPTPTAAATAGTTPTAAATASATGTPAASGTPTATSTPTTTTSNPAATIPVKVTNVIQGTTNQNFTILTTTPLQTGDIYKLMGAITSNGGPYVQLVSNSEVGPSVASETTRNAVFAVLAASAAILLYVWFSFRKVPRPWRYGASAIIALLHDVLVVLGVFSILGWLFNIQIDSLFVTALLTIVGFSVHDTIVVFDRIRENMQRRTIETFDQVVNASLVQTMARSLNTSLTVLFTLSALTLFGGVSIRTFTLTLLVGIFSGTYSSIFNASMLLVMWEKHEWVFGWFNRNRVEEKRPNRELVGTR